MRAQVAAFAVALVTSAVALLSSRQPVAETLIDSEYVEACATGRQPISRPAVASFGDVVRVEANPGAVEADFSGPIDLIVEVAGDVDEIDVDALVVPKGVTLPRLHVRRSRSSAIFGMPISVFEARQEIDIAATTSTQGGTLSWGDFSPILFRVRIGEVVKATATVAIVPSAGVPAAPVRRINDSLQYSSHVINVRSRAEIDGRASTTREIATAADELLRETVYRNFRDLFDQTIVVTSYGFTWRYSGYWEGVRNAVSGIGRSILTPVGRDSAGSAVRQGRILIRDTYSSSLLLHEIAHQWGDFFNWQAIAGQAAPDVPHTPLWGLFESPVSNKLPLQLFLANRDGTWMTQIVDSPRYPPLYLYAMGRLERAGVPDIPVFVDQQQQPTLTVNASGDVRTATIGDVIRVHGERTGPRVDQWRVAIIVLTPDRLLSAAEMSFHNYVSQRMSDPGGETWLVPTFAKMTGADLVTAVEPLDVEPFIAPRFDPAPVYNGRDINWMTLESFPATLSRDRRQDVRGLVDRSFVALTDVREVAFRFTPMPGGPSRQFGGPVNSSGAFLVTLDPSALAPGRYTVTVVATNLGGRLVEEPFGSALDVRIR